MISEEELKRERIKIYFDCICGSICAITAFLVMAYLIPVYGVYNFNAFIFWLTFWILWLSLSLFIIFLGIYTWYKEKHFDETKQKHRDLKPPII